MAPPYIFILKLSKMRLFQHRNFETAAVDLREKAGSGPLFSGAGFKTNRFLRTGIEKLGLNPVFFLNLDCGFKSMVLSGQGVLEPP
jgi:hypothetical protein